MSSGLTFFLQFGEIHCWKEIARFAINLFRHNIIFVNHTIELRSLQDVILDEIIWTAAVSLIARLKMVSGGYGVSVSQFCKELRRMFSA